MDRSVIAPSAALICSPAESSMSSSRGEGRSLISFAFCSRPSVVSPCAGENDDHVVAFVHPRFDDVRHAQKMRIVAHGAAAEFLYDQAHKNHFQQKMD